MTGILAAFCGAVAIAVAFLVLLARRTMVGWSPQAAVPQLPAILPPLAPLALEAAPPAPRAVSASQPCELPSCGSPVGDSAWCCAVSGEEERVFCSVACVEAWKAADRRRRAGRKDLIR